MSLFSREEKHYERYAAALAATEPLRKQRDMRAKQTLRPFEYQVLKRRGKLSSARGICDLPKVDPNQRNGRLRVVCSGHVKTMSSVIRALGMTVPEFNGLSREVAANPDLRERVKLQAYYYRVAAELTRSAAAAEEIPPDVMQRPPEGGWGAAEQQQQQQQQQQQTPSKPPAKPKPEKPAPVPMVVFAKVSHRIEALRQRQENLLKQELKMEASELPPGICGAAYGPLLNPKVRGLCQTFPAEAQKVVEGYGVDVEGFNMMLARADRDPFLRWRVGRVLRKAQAKASAAAKEKAKAAKEREKMSRFFASSETN